MKKPPRRRSGPAAPEFRRRFTHEFTFVTRDGKPVTVRYNRVPVRGGYDIEAEIVSPRKPVEQKDEGGGEGTPRCFSDE
jgi:hypothetical protein